MLSDMYLGKQNDSQVAIRPTLHNLQKEKNNVWTLYLKNFWPPALLVF